MNSGVGWAASCKVRTAAIHSAVENPFISEKRYAGDSPGRRENFEVRHLKITVHNSPFIKFPSSLEGKGAL
jgi:hypothetical protein